MKKLLFVLTVFVMLGAEEFKSYMNYNENYKGNFK